MSGEAPRLKIQAGGAVNAAKAVYIERSSDNELLEWLEQGEYCNVLCSRQMGKTSLLHRARGRLVEKGIRSVLIDVAGSLGTVENADDWYVGMLQVIAGELGIEVDARSWWQASRAATSNQRLIQFLREQVLQRVDGKVVIFLDEIDSTLKLPYTDDLFVAIRSMYNDRVSESAYERLVFCLIGVATPNELIKERRTTPYNIGRTIELRDFDPKRDDLTPLSRAVSDDPETGKAIVQAVLRWSGGHPYLTARLCEEVVRGNGRSPEDVDRLVEQGYSRLQELERDTHFEQVLRFMQERVDDRFNTLALYTRIWRGRREPDRTSPAHVRLKLAGIAKRDAEGRLAVRNPIYHRIFTAKWARASMPAMDRRLRRARTITVAAVIAAAVGVLPVAWLQTSSQQIDVLERSLDDYNVAYDAYQKLRDIPFRRDKADELWARFFERRALRAEFAEERDQAILWRLKAQQVRPGLERARRTGALIGNDYDHLVATLRTGTPGPPADRLDMYLNPRLVAFSPDGQKVLTGSFDNTARLWNASDGSPIGKPLKHSNPVRAVAFSSDGSRVLTGSSDNTARLWNASDGSPIGKPLKHSGWVLAVAFSPDNSRVLTGSSDKTARLWNASDGSPVGKPLPHRNPVFAVAFNRDGSRVLTGSSDNTARLWNASNGSPIGKPLQHSGPVWSVAFSPDGSRVLTCSFNNIARLWNTSDGSPSDGSLQHSDPVRAVAFSPDASRVLTGSSDDTARLWNASDGSPIGQSLQHSDSVRAVAFSPDGFRVLTGSADNTARLWNALDGSPIGEPLRHSDVVEAVDFSPDGSRVLTGSSDNTARLWSASDGSPIGKPLRHDKSVIAVAFNPDGSKILTGSDDHTARLWNASDGSPIGKPLQHSGLVGTVAFSPDGSKILTGSFDNTARLWNASDGSPIGKPLQHSSLVGTVAFSHDGSRVVTATQSWIHISQVTPDGVIPHANVLLSVPLIAFRIRDNAANHVQVAIAPTGNSVRVLDLEPGNLKVEPLEGDPTHLIDVWQRKLGLRLTEAGTIEALHQ